MTPEQFIATWKDNSLSEKGGAQPHFEDLCKLLGVAPPRAYGEYCYEQDLEKMLGGKGFADVWKRGCFAWENKGPDKDLAPALMQLKNYAGALDNPPVLVVCNRERVEIHANFNGYPNTAKVIPLADIGQPDNLQALRWLFSPDTVQNLRPKKSNAAITAEAAAEFARLADAMRARGLDAQKVAHFLIQSIFCMYAEDEGLLHNGPTQNPQIFTAILNSAGQDAARAIARIRTLFEAMQNRGGTFGIDDIAWFNGGLFATIDIPPLTADDLQTLRRAAADLDWRAIDPTIFGTLFERGLDPKARAPLGAFYTDVATINKLIEPVITRPLAAEWEQAKEKIAAALEKESKAGRPKAKNDARRAAQAAYYGYLERLRHFRVLDPACGSGNFLYLAMRALKDLEQKAQIDAELMGLERQISIETGPANVLGIEINEFAAELARATVWIGDLQWSRENGRPISHDPILKPLDGIEHRDALLNPDGNEADWPACDAIVSNPPFLGGSKKRGELGDATFDALAKAFSRERVPPGADLVCYWFDKARQHIKEGKAKTAGLVATQAIRNGTNRTVLDNICRDSRIFEAWRDESWINDGAAVRVSLVCLGAGDGAMLDGQPVAAINVNLTAGSSTSSSDLTQAKPLAENRLTSFQGSQKIGAFDIDGDLARQWLSKPNPNGKPNIEVLKPCYNGLDVTRRPRDIWIIDFGVRATEHEAALFEAPFEFLVKHVKPERIHNPRAVRAKYWWRHGDPQPAMRSTIADLRRYIATPEVAKHRTFSWLDASVLPDKKLIVVARADDTSFGILHSRMHEVWALANASMHGVGNDPRYTPTTCFETFPFPAGLTPKDTAQGVPDTPAARAIADAAVKLNALRENWLNPPEWTDWVITPEEEKAGFPKRPVAKPGFEAELKKRTLTNLYNARPAWLAALHEALDRAVAAAYGWEDYTPAMPDDEILRRLLALNLLRS